MGFEGDFARLRRLASGFKELAGKEAKIAMAAGIAAEVNGLLREQFQQGVDPSGSPWQKTMRKGAALLSLKLPSSISSYIRPDAITFKSKIPWLGVHQEGHVFSARHATRVGAMHFNLRGKLISARAFVRSTKAGKFITDATGGHWYYGQTKTGKRKLLGIERRPAPHTVGQRVLPQRMIYPEPGAMPPRWSEAIRRGAMTGLGKYTSNLAAT